MNIDHIIQLTEKKLSLLKELKESVKYENSTYHMVVLDEQYHLYSTGNRKLVKSFRDKESILKYLNVRGLTESSVYGY